MTRQADGGVTPYERLSRMAKVRRFVRRNPTMVAGALLLLFMVLLAVFAPFLKTVNPVDMNPVERLRAPVADHWFGTDMYGRDSYSRVIYGARISLFVGLVVAAITSVVGLAIGLVSGFVRKLDNIIMRVMDGIMALPDLLLAISFVALTKASVRNVIIALVIPQTPRVVRLVRSIVLTLREQPFIEAATAMGARVPRIMVRHLLPNTLAALIVQGTYVMASAVLIEAGLEFLGSRDAAGNSRAGATSWPRPAPTSGLPSGCSSSPACSWRPRCSPSTLSGTVYGTCSTRGSPGECGSEATKGGRNSVIGQVDKAAMRRPAFAH